MTCDVHTKPPKPIQVAADVHTKPLDPALVGEVCAECATQAETIWGDRFYCMEHGWQEWERFGDAVRRMKRRENDLSSVG